MNSSEGEKEGRVDAFCLSFFSFQQYHQMLREYHGRNAAATVNVKEQQNSKAVSVRFHPRFEISISCAC